MPSCCVPGCRSNFDKDTDSIPVFPFPKDDSLKEKWLRTINMTNYTVNSNSQVCIKHFENKFILHLDRISTAADSFLIVKLTDDAYPTIFPEVNREQSEGSRGDSISTFEDCKTHIQKRLEHFKQDFDIHIFEKSIYIYKFSESCGKPKVVTLAIKDSLLFQVYAGNDCEDVFLQSRIQDILGCNKVDRWSYLMIILYLLNNLEVNGDTQS